MWVFYLLFGISVLFPFVLVGFLGVLVWRFRFGWNVCFLFLFFVVGVGGGFLFVFWGLVVLLWAFGGFVDLFCLFWWAGCGGLEVVLVGLVRVGFGCFSFGWGKFHLVRLCCAYFVLGCCLGLGCTYLGWFCLIWVGCLVVFGGWVWVGVFGWFLVWGFGLW